MADTISAYLEGTEPSERLRTLIKGIRDISVREAARQLGVTPAGVHGWIDEEPLRRRTPEHPHRRALEVWSKGVDSEGRDTTIHAEEWETDAEREIVARVKPYVSEADDDTDSPSIAGLPKPGKPSTSQMAAGT